MYVILKVGVTVMKLYRVKLREKPGALIIIFSIILDKRMLQGSSFPRNQKPILRKCCFAGIPVIFIQCKRTCFVVSDRKVINIKLRLLGLNH